MGIGLFVYVCVRVPDRPHIMCTRVRACVRILCVRRYIIIIIISMYLCVRVRAKVCLRMCMRAYVCIRAYVRASKSVRACVRACACVCTRVC